MLMSAKERFHVMNVNLVFAQIQSVISHVNLNAARVVS